MDRDPYDLQRFVSAQNDMFEQACAELRGGRNPGLMISAQGKPNLAGQKLTDHSTAPHLRIRNRSEHQPGLHARSSGHLRLTGSVLPKLYLLLHNLRYQ